MEADEKGGKQGSEGGSGGDEAAGSGRSGSSVSSKLEAASKPQLIALLTKQMARIKEAERRAAELSAQSMQRQRETEEDRQAVEAREREWQSRAVAAEADCSLLRQQLQQARAQQAEEAAANERQQHVIQQLRERLEQLQQQQPQQSDRRSRESDGSSQSVSSAAAVGDVSPAASSTAPSPSTAVDVDDDEQRRLSGDVLELRHAAVVRSYEERLSALNGTLVKYKGVTAKLHDKLKAMAEQIKQANHEQSVAAAQQAEAETVIQRRADETGLILEMVDAVMGNKERALWEADMHSEHQQAVRPAKWKEVEQYESEQQQQTDSEAHRGDTSTNGVG